MNTQPQNKPATILVTGGSGYIGSHTIVSLIEAGHSVVSIDNLSKSTGRLNDGIAQITGHDVDFHEIDASDEDALNALFSQYSFDAVIHFAAYKAIDESTKKPLDYYDNNLGSLTTLCRVMRAHDVSQLIFSSSATVYGDQNTACVETMDIQPAMSPYGWTKIFCEQILRDLSASDPDFWNITLLRYFNPVGNHPSGLIGEDSPDVPANLVPYITKVAIGELESLTVFGDSYDTVDGTCVRDYIHVTDLAEGHIAALTQADPGIHTYNLSSGRGTTVLQAIKGFESATGQTVTYTIGHKRDGDTPYSCGSAKKAEQELGWKAQRTFTEAMRDQWKWQQNQ